MPEKYSGHNHPDRSKHIKNTDNESTRFFNIHSDNENTAQFNRADFKRQAPTSSEHGYRSNSYYGEEEYYNAPRSAPQSRSDYYGSDSPVNRRQYSVGEAPPPRKKSSGGGSSPSKKRPPSSSGGGSRHKGSTSPERKAPQPQRRASSAPPPKKKKKKKKRSLAGKIILRVFISLLTIFLIIFGIYSCTAISLIKKLNHKESGDRNHSASALSASHVTNILLIGTDGRSSGENSRSDTMILLSINKSTDKIILTSLMRDSYVNIPGRGMDKLGHAHAYGGPELLMDTIEHNFNVRIDDYIAVNFSSFAAIVDSIDGLELEISDAEAKEINTILQAEVNELMGDPVNADLLSGGGKLRLNGKQTLAYARIRHVGNADFERTERQRKVLTGIAAKLKGSAFSAIGSIADEVMPNVTTNMTGTELYFLSLRAPFLLGSDIEQLQIPAEGTYRSETTSNGGSALGLNFEENNKLIEDIVFAE